MSLKVMSGARDITLLYCSPNLAGIVANKIEHSFYSDYSYSRMESIERTLSLDFFLKYKQESQLRISYGLRRLA